MGALLFARFTPVEDTPYCNENNAAQILGVTGTFLGLALVTVVLRIYVRARMLKFVGPDDYIMILASIFAIGTFTCFVGETVWGMGRHNKCIPLSDLEMELKWEFYHAIWIVLGVVSVKISIAFFLMRLAAKANWKKFLWGCVVFLVCFGITCFCTLVFSCVPIAAHWDLALAAKPGTKCFSGQTYSRIGLFNSIINIITDVLFAVLPIPIIVKLQVNKRTKIVLAFILSLGWVACAAGIVKARLQLTFITTPDSNWDDSFNVWNMIEFCLGIIAASLPSLKPLFRSFLETTKTALGLSTGSRSRSRPGQNTPAGYAGFSQRSEGYRRQYDPRSFNDMLDDVDLQEYKKAPTISAVETKAEAEPIVRTLSSAARPKYPHGTRVTSRELSPEHRGWVSNVPELARSESQEQLHPSGIYKTLEIISTSEPGYQQ